MPIPTDNAAPPPRPALSPQGLWGMRSVPRLTGLFALLLLASFALQYPTHTGADWALFSFYDAGTTLKGDLLLEKGYIPTQDFGYTHGLLPLLYGRAGFSLLGRTPWAYMALTLVLELVMAFALARIAFATGLARSRPALRFLIIALPMAIMPLYLTLTHPLEAMLILLALAAQTAGPRGKGAALALMTVCLFVKPSMAYVYGFLLVVLLLVERRRNPLALLKDLLPAAIVFLLLASLLTLRFGFTPVYQTLLPLTGAKTYASTGFGFFTPTGRSFWLPFDEPWRYIVAPPGIWLIAAITTAAGAALAALHLTRHKPAAPNPVTPHRRSWELLLTLGTLHTAFILGFYGWSGSWTYYSYLPVLGLALSVHLLARDARRQSRISAALAILMFLSHGLIFAFAFDGWRTKTPQGDNLPGAAQGLYRYPYLWQDWKAALAAIGNRKTLILSNGYLFDLAPNLHMPDAWFPEPGIPTASEIARVKKQIATMDCILLWHEYGPSKSHPDLQLWSFPELANERGQFEPELVTPNKQFILLRRIGVP